MKMRKPFYIFVLVCAASAGASAASADSAVTLNFSETTVINGTTQGIDPTVPLAAEILEPAHGALITSATLRDVAIEGEDWKSAEVRTGALHLPQPPKRASFGSPFRYDHQARIFVVKDVARRDPDSLAAAMRELFLAAGGGALGLFTAVKALRDTEARIAQPLADAGLALYAQHVDRLDTGALVDLFRAEENACLLGTDALRDGVDRKSVV